MKLLLKSSNQEITITKANFLASGGEGDIYAKNGFAYKIYSDKNKIMPYGKIQDLSAIDDENVIRPKDILLENNIPVGYSMRFVQNTVALCQLFPRGFKERNNINQIAIQNIIKKLHTIVKNVHDKNILIVDLNELNFLVNDSFSEVYAIDTDSYQTPHYPATAIMDSIRDWHSKDFNKNTDWFSFGVLAFQLLIGIHPFKGSHPSIKSFQDRMKANISVFNKDVGIPKVCYPLDSIPEVYRNWFKAVFDEAKRIPPPNDFQAVANLISAIKQIVGSNLLDIQEISSYIGNIRDIIIYGGTNSVLSDKKLYVNNQEFDVGNNVKLCIFPKIDGVFLAKIDNGFLKLFSSTRKQEVNVSIAASEVMVYNGQLYIKNGDKILEVEMMEAGKNLIVTGNQIANVLENASKMYDGVVVQNLLGTYYFSTFPVFKTHRQTRIKELDKYKVVDARFDKGILMVIAADRAGIYSRFTVKFSTDHASYELKEIKNITPAGLNFVVLDNGICVHITEDEHINVFSNKTGVDKVTDIKDDVISGNMKLFASGAKLMFATDNKLFSIKMK